ncbi:MAG: thioredoxin family protein [Tangfeifania sp.]
MRKLVFIVAIAVFSLQSCNAGQSNNNSNDKTAENSAPVQTVSQSSDSEGGSVKLTKSKFIDDVWDYENSPEEWKFKGDKPALIDFYADWCGPCKIASPILEEISNEYAGQITVYKVDTEVERELASVFGVRSIPAFLYIPENGKPVMMSGIARTKEDTKKMFKDNIDKYLLTSN